MDRTVWTRWPVAGALVLAAAAGLGLGLLVGGSGDAADGDGAEAATARNVIVLQGDGLGVAARDLLRLATVGRAGRIALDRPRHLALMRTDPAGPEAAVTDSAAGATAYASGVRTVNGAVGVDADGRSRRTLLERAKAAGKATGLVTTSQVTDASPAAFAAHVEDRADQEEIARQFVEESRPDVVLGGGAEAFGDDLLARARDQGYDLASTRDELRRARGPRLLGLFGPAELFTAAPEGEGDEYDPEPRLGELTDKALELLARDEDGFFLFVEEEAIDEFAHANNARRTLQALRAYERVVGRALRLAERRGDTLVVVLGDHATGGLAIEDAGDGDDGPFEVAGGGPAFSVDWTTGGHTGEAVPVGAEGPGAEAFRGVLDNTDVHDVLARAMGL